MTEQEYYDEYTKAMWAFIITPCGSIGEKCSLMARFKLEQEYYRDFNKFMDLAIIKEIRDKMWIKKRALADGE